MLTMNKHWLAVNEHTVMILFNHSFQSVSSKRDVCNVVYGQEAAKIPAADHIHLFHWFFINIYLEIPTLPLLS